MYSSWIENEVLEKFFGIHLSMSNYWDWAQAAKTTIKSIHLGGYGLRIDFFTLLNNDD